MEKRRKSERQRFDKEEQPIRRIWRSTGIVPEES